MDHSINILLIEDNPGDVRLIQEYLKDSRMQRYRLFHKDTLAGGRAILATEQINIILLDLNLPDSLGFDTFDLMFKEFPAHPFIVLTGFSDETFGLRAVKKGAQDFLNKNELNNQVLSKSIQYALERHQMLRRLERAQQLAKVGNWEISLKTKEFYCSNEVYTIFGRGKDLSFDSFDDYIAAIHVQDRVLVNLAFKRAYEKGGAFKIDHRIQFDDGSEKHVVLQGSAVTSEGIEMDRLVGTIQDITDRKQFEELIRKKELAEQTARLKQEFLANTSHEIRTPLNAILLLTEILLKDQPNSQQRKYLNLISNAGSTLLAVVNDVLDLSKIEANKMDFATANFSLSQVVDSMTNMLEIKAQEDDLEIITHIADDVPDILIGDSVRLNQILINLVNNAIKFTHNGYVKIDIKKLKKGEKNIVIQFVVSDTGIGIPQNKLSTIFESFKRVENNVHRKYSGTGLGLSIVEQLVKLQGGSIQVKSEVGKGSVFTFELPFGIGESNSMDIATPNVWVEEDQLNGINILVVEDNETNQLVTERILSDWGVKVDIAKNGYECIDRLKENAYHLILMDIQMPEMDGYQTTRHIRSEMNAVTRKIPIIALTANAFTGMDDECLKAGMDDYVSKPFKAMSLYSKIVQNLKLDGAGNPLLHAEEKRETENNIHLRHKIENTHNLNHSAQHTYTDLSYLNEICSGDMGVIKRVIEKYLETTPEIIDGMEQSLHNKEYVELSKLAHKLKSSVANMGISAIKETVANIEQMSKNADRVQALPALVKETKMVVEKSYEELSSQLTASQVTVS